MGKDAITGAAIATDDENTYSSVLPYLRSLVKTEAVSLSGWIPDKHKSVHFCTFDYSSTLPPVDRVQGSGTNQKESIESLREAKIEMDRLLNLRNDEKERIRIRESLSELYDFLASPSATWLESCAASVSIDHPLRRVGKAVSMYSNEIRALLSRFDGNESPSFIEKRLAEFVGQALRYHLRVLLLPAPPRLSPEDKDYMNWSKRHSQVHNQIIMTPITKKAKEITEDRLQSLFVGALDFLCKYFGLDQLLATKFDGSIIPTSFCQKPASQHSILKNGGPRALSNEEVKQVFADIDEAANILSAKRATDFLCGLLSSAKVQEEIERQGGWKLVETYAQYSREFELWKLCPEDEHLVALCDFEFLFRRLGEIVTVMELPSHAAQKSLDELSKRFRLKTKSVNLRKSNPEIGTVGVYLDERLQYESLFPTVSEA